MSAQQKVQMEFVVSSDSLNKLSAIMGGAGSGSSGGSQTKGVGGLQEIMKKMSIGQIGKLAAIGIGVTGIMGLVKKITSLMVESSPMLQSMLKLFQVGLMFVLRPIGDFVGFLLRPLMIYLLRNVFLPWYRQMAPIMRLWGGSLGNDLVNFFKDPIGSAKSWVEESVVGKIVAALFPVIGILAGIGFIRDAVTGLKIDFGEINAAVGEKVRIFFDSITNALNGWWTNTLGKFNEFAETLSSGLDSVVTKLSNAWSTLSLFFQGALGNVGILLGGAWSSFTTWINESLGGVGTTLETAWNSFTSFFMSIGSVWNLVGQAWSDFLSFITDLGNTLNSLNPGNFFADIGNTLKSMDQQMMGGGNTNNQVNVEVLGGGGNIAEDAINGLKEMVFGWLEDSNSKR